MAGSLSKREELLGLISELQCHECKDVPGPSGNQKNRYSCTKAAHTLCEKDKTKCACGSKVGESPSPVIAKLLQNLPWMCQNYKTGCRESKMNVGDLEHHQGKCIYRQVVCPNVDCEEEGKVLFKDVIDHLQICLDEPIEEVEMSNEEANNFLVSFITNEQLDDGDNWLATKMTSTCGAVFFLTGYVKHETVYFWLQLLGSSDETKKYLCTNLIKNEIGNEKFIYSGLVHTLDKGYEDIIASGSLLSIGVDAAKRSMGDKKSFEVEITIRNLKEEANDDDMESGVSDGE
jgi:hypothetical protein